LKWYQIILTKLPTDAGVLTRVGSIFFRVTLFVKFLGRRRATSSTLLFGSISTFAHKH
jgi:hypothetical protein